MTHIDRWDESRWGTLEGRSLRGRLEERRPRGSWPGFIIAVGLVSFCVTIALHRPWDARAEAVSPRLGHVAMAVRDVDQAVAWYRDTLGFQRVSLITIDADVSPQGIVARRLFGPDLKILRIAQMKSANQVGLELFELARPAADTRHSRNDPKAGFLHLGLIVPDVEIVLQKVVQNGGRLIVSGAPNAKRRVVFCQDPDGNVIEIASGPWDGM